MTKDAFVLEVKQSAELLHYLMVINGLFLASIALMLITRHRQTLLFDIHILSFIHYYQSHHKKTGRHTVSQLMLSECLCSVDFGDDSRVEDLSLRQILCSHHWSYCISSLHRAREQHRLTCWLIKLMQNSYGNLECTVEFPRLSSNRGVLGGLVSIGFRVIQCVMQATTFSTF